MRSHLHSSALTLAGLGFVICAACVSSDAEHSTADRRIEAQTSAQADPPPKPGGRAVGVSAELTGLYDEYLAYRESGSDEGFRPSSALVRVRDGRVLVDFTATTDGEALQADLEALGLTKGAVYQQAVSGWLPILAIPDLGALESLRLARPAISAVGTSPTNSHSLDPDS